MDEIRRRRLTHDHEKLCQLARESRRFAFQPVQGEPPERYLFDLDCVTLVKPERGEVQKQRGCIVQVYLPAGYPRREGPIALLHHPAAIWHPNIDPATGGICPGAFVPGLFLDTFVYRLYHLLVYRNFTMDERQSLNPAAAAWARHAGDWFPTDGRPLMEAP
jgi:ubiquitin-protein ligase